MKSTLSKKVWQKLDFGFILGSQNHEKWDQKWSKRHQVRLLNFKSCPSRCRKFFWLPLGGEGETHYVGWDFPVPLACSIDGGSERVASPQMSFSQDQYVFQPGQRCFLARTQMSFSQNTNVFWPGHRCPLAAKKFLAAKKKNQGLQDLRSFLVISQQHNWKNNFLALHQGS